MEKDTVQGKAESVLGHAKQAAGEVTGNNQLQAEGAVDQAKGEFHQTVGAVKKLGKDIVDGAHEGAETAKSNS